MCIIRHLMHIRSLNAMKGAIERETLLSYNSTERNGIGFDLCFFFLFQFAWL